MLFSQLVGNSVAKETLQKMVDRGVLPSTLLFHGPDGVGKGAFALALAEHLLGLKSARSQGHPDLHILHPLGKSATHPIEQIRKLLDEAALPPYEAPVKIFILHDAHQMLPSSSNALLKVLEEPYPHSHFILLTSSLELILPTILSRARKVPFFPLAHADIEGVVQHKWQKSPSEARRIAFFSHGSLARADSLCHHPKPAWKEPLMTLLSLDPARDEIQMYALLDEIQTSLSEEDAPSFSDQLEEILETILMWQRDRHLLHLKTDPKLLYHLDQVEQLKVISAPLFPLETLLERGERARLALQRSLPVRAALAPLLFI